MANVEFGYHTCPYTLRQARLIEQALHDNGGRMRAVFACVRHEWPKDTDPEDILTLIEQIELGRVSSANLDIL
jgi:hypothetical protein